MYKAPGATPAAMVQVIVPLFSVTLHIGGPPVAHAGEPATSVVPVGAESVTTIGAVVVADPVFVTVSVYTIGVVEPATTPPLGLAALTTVTLVTVRDKVEVANTVGPCGGSPETVAVSEMDLLDRSACVTV